MPSVSRMPLTAETFYHRYDNVYDLLWFYLPCESVNEEQHQKMICRPDYIIDILFSSSVFLCLKEKEQRNDKNEDR